MHANETLNETVKMCDGKKPRIDEIRAEVVWSDCRQLDISGSDVSTDGFRRVDTSRKTPRRISNMKRTVGKCFGKWEITTTSNYYNRVCTRT